MNGSVLLILGGILTYVGGLVYLANQVEAARTSQDGTENVERWTRWVRWLLYGLAAMTFFLGLNVFQIAGVSQLMGDDVPANLAQDVPEISLRDGLLVFAVAIAAGGGILLLVSSAPVRAHVQEWVNRLGGVYNADSLVHLAAAALMLAIVVWMLVTFVMEGGISGVAERIQQNGFQPGDVAFQAVLQIVVTALGVGFAIRRGLAEVISRLGLRWPTVQDLTWGAGLGFVFVIVLIGFNAIWVALTSPELLEEQTAAAMELNAAFATLPLAFLLSISAAFGEEIWIRGGLQPVFGIFITSIFFAALHIQVAFTPATLIIFGVSLGLGWLRWRYSTTAAIVAHFTFNFVQLSLASLAIGMST
jgi:uncharacterized protein